MKFVTREDIEAPIDHVFKVLTDFEGFERQAMRRGAEVRRLDELEVPGEGARWALAFPFRGKPREMTVVCTEYDAPLRLNFESVMSGLDGDMKVELVALSRGRTRLSLEIEFKPKTLSARLLVQSIKLAKANISKRFQIKVAEFAKSTEENYKRMA
ncbi:SRPBCC family protein [Rhodalgimonas zhirmunskyi]|uniref:SRPBCC family protein n=1 Tax=Rhodalgimonas zhirmunskyi TaxID=2964767 RepID=A0AAJ1X756_9RHOB|nr:SRPBCC family protein [Rhodoalgimonas zhirmunskyi]MDQ2094177.1 SRPBCC family protein [Rhodoalgimonas zhirmunskyi]